jgi:phosphatidylglycerol lysyltransferase
MAAMGFVVQVHLFGEARERRYFVAEQAGRVVGFLGAVPVYARHGWLFEDLLRDPRAPNGTSEALIDLAMRTVAAEGAEYATLGLVPLTGRVSPWLRLAAYMGSGLYDFSGLHAFRKKLRPTAWHPIYLALPRRAWTIVAFYDVLVAFAKGSLVRFMLRTLAHGTRSKITSPDRSPPDSFKRSGSSHTE